MNGSEVVPMWHYPITSTRFWALSQASLQPLSPYGNAAQALNLNNKEITDNMSSVNSQLQQPSWVVTLHCKLEKSRYDMLTCYTCRTTHKVRTRVEIMGHTMIYTTDHDDHNVRSQQSEQLKDP